MKENIDILYKTVGQKIKEIRKTRKVKQEKLANLISLSRSSISNIEAGKHQPSVFVIYEIALALDCNLDDLLPSINNYKTSKKLIDKKYSVILNSHEMGLSNKNLSIIKELINRKDDK